MIFGIGRGFAEVQILKKVTETGPIPWTFWYILIKFCIPITTDMMTEKFAKSSPRDCKMTFNIGRGCAELQILKK